MCNSEVIRESLPTDFEKSLNKIPAVLIGRLAVDSRYKGRGYGEHALVNALRMIQNISLISAIKVVVVDALNMSAKNFYMNYGFKEFDDDKMRLFISMKEINTL